jgi:hypothetical protein
MKLPHLLNHFSSPRTALSFALSALWLAAGGNAQALDTFNYGRYPASATVNQTCKGSDVRTTALRVDGVPVYSLNLHNAGPLRPGAVITWVFTTDNANCTKEVVSLAMYTATGDPVLENNVQVMIGSRSETLWTGQKSLTLTVPGTFCGPYQIDGVLGQPLPRIGKGASFYDGYYRNNNPTSDYRDMLTSVGSNVGETTGPTVSGTMCREALTRFPDKAITDFDYLNYPNNQLTVDPQRCSTGSVNDAGTSRGFFVNGKWIGNDATKLVLKPLDVVEYRFSTGEAACDTQKISLALYRNPNGANGLNTALNQRLVVNDTTKVEAYSRAIKSLTITVPADWNGGWQLDVAFGSPIPIVGDVGRTYSGGAVNMLKTAAHGFIGK